MRHLVQFRVYITKPHSIYLLCLSTSIPSHSIFHVYVSRYTPTTKSICKIFFIVSYKQRTSIFLIMTHKKCARGIGIGFWNSERLDWSFQTGVGAPTAPRSRHSRETRVGIRSPAHLSERKF